MASRMDEVFAGGVKKSQSVVLKVQINCNCCARKVKKAIGQVEGVESIAVDVTQKKVTVTGSFDSSKLLKKVAKTGKNVEMTTASKESGTKVAKEKPGGAKLIPNSDQTGTVFPAEDAFLFSEENATGCTIM